MPALSRIDPAEGRVDGDDSPAASGDGSADAAVLRTEVLGTPRIYRGVVSVDDARYARQMRMIDGVRVRVMDADREPLDVDMRLSVGRWRQDWRNMRPGSRMYVRGLSGQRYHIQIDEIDPDEETVWFTMRAEPAPSARSASPVE